MIIYTFVLVSTILWQIKDLITLDVLSIVVELKEMNICIVSDYLVCVLDKGAGVGYSLWNQKW